MCGCVDQCFVRPSDPFILMMCHSQYHPQERSAGVLNQLKNIERESRQCEYPACGAKAKDGAVLHKCVGCRVALYCSKAHAVLRMPEHESFCVELTRVCSLPGCEERAYARVTCRQCKVATYCSKGHRDKHSTAHESLCQELRRNR
jgi:hypothetical protein